MRPDSHHESEAEAQADEDQALWVKDALGARLGGGLGAGEGKPEEQYRADEFGNPGRI